MIAGIAFSLLAALALNFGNILQKDAVDKMPGFSARRGVHLVRTLVASKSWLSGLALCILGLGLQVMAFALAPIPVVQSIFNAGIVLLIVLSRLRLKERLGRYEWVGLGIVIISLVSLSASLSGRQSAIGLGGSGSEVLAAALPTVVVVALLVVFMRSTKKGVGYLYGVGAGLLYGVAALGTKGASTLVVRHGVISSIPFVFESAYPYVFLAMSLLGMVMYQTGLQRFRIAVVGTMCDVVCSTYLVAVGMVVFGESLPSDTIPLILRLAGFAGVLGGAVLVAFGGRDEMQRSIPIVESDLGLGTLLATQAGLVPED
jgi:hypothetical protein